MALLSKALFQRVPAESTHNERQETGILPLQELRALVRAGVIEPLRGAGEPIAESQIQPASLDLRLGPIAYRVVASFLPGKNRAVADKIQQYGQYQLDLTKSAVLERDAIYIVPLQESLKLPGGVQGQANPKSSAGRLDIFTRLITDNSAAFDAIEPGYDGPLFAEISPRTFNIAVRAGTRLSQLRLRRGHAPAAELQESALKRLQDEIKLVHGDRDADIYRGKIGITIDLRGERSDGLIGYKAKRDTAVIDFDKVGYYEPWDFWEPIVSRTKNGIVLNRDDFYILSSREPIRVPKTHAAEMVAYDTLTGEFRVHYAGFFDPGFGLEEAGGGGSRAVLEVRPHDVPFMVEHGQLVGRLLYERLTQPPDRLYGSGMGSTYQAQGLRLSKHFKPVA